LPAVLLSLQLSMLLSLCLHTLPSLSLQLSSLLPAMLFCPDLGELRPCQVLLRGCHHPDARCVNPAPMASACTAPV
jgi:hypothetical protein